MRIQDNWPDIYPIGQNPLRHQELYVFVSLLLVNLHVLSYANLTKKEECLQKLLTLLSLIVLRDFIIYSLLTEASKILFLNLGFDGLGFFLITRFLKKCKHIFLICFYSGLVERVYSQHISAYAASFLKEIDKLT